MKLVVVFYIFLSLLAFTAGAMGANENRNYGCFSIARIERAFPSYRLACYLFETDIHEKWRKKFLQDDN